MYSVIRGRLSPPKLGGGKDFYSVVPNETFLQANISAVSSILASLAGQVNYYGGSGTGWEPYQDSSFTLGRWQLWVPS